MIKLWKHCKNSSSFYNKYESQPFDTENMNEQISAQNILLAYFCSYEEDARSNYFSE